MAIVFTVCLVVFAILVFREVRETGILRRQAKRQERDHDQIP